MANNNSDQAKHFDRHPAGIAYELQVLDALRAAAVPGLVVPHETAGFSKTRPDIEASYSGAPWNIEIKSHDGVSMGSVSFTYNMFTRMFNRSRESELGALDLTQLLAATEEIRPAIEEYIAAAQRMEPKICHSWITGLPLKISLEARDKLHADGAMRGINKSVKCGDSSFITRHYNRRNVFYIQRGGCGLFFMGQNPLNLPVPELSGEVTLHMRLGFAGGGSGARPVVFQTTPPTPARFGSLRVTGRLSTKQKSPYNLDNPKSVQDLFQNRLVPVGRQSMPSIADLLN